MERDDQPEEAGNAKTVNVLNGEALQQLTIRSATYFQFSASEARFKQLNLVSWVFFIFAVKKAAGAVNQPETSSHVLPGPTAKELLVTLIALVSWNVLTRTLWP
ncbi:hypothetical protein PC118_g17173 [Phytophthora cactorum]|uniref:Uncharacterized protein n=1 Tax=Phytophthora cactorum TaxID=29920 RepID=A0A8T1FCR0_9STRA|nr:hypothetical protein PC118_g17173 [Phytophthora cactorum]